MKKWLIGVAIVVVVGGIVVAAITVMQSDPYGSAYGRLLKSQGYVPLKHPRTDFGVGSIVPLDSGKNIFIAGQDECFPGLQKSFQEGTTKLVDSQDFKNLRISASGNFAPTGSSGFLSKVAAALGYTDSSKLQVNFGETRSINLTEVGLQKYLVGHRIANVCTSKLRDPKNAIIFSMARVSSMTYTFSGQKGLSASASPEALNTALNGAGTLSLSHTQDNSVTITTPLFVGYNAFSLNDLQIEVPESSTASYVVRSVKILKASARLPE